MPNIREYNSTKALQGLQTTSAGSDAIASGGRQMGQLAAASGRAYEEGAKSLVEGAASVAEEHFGRQEVLKNAADEMTMRNSLEDQWNTFRNTETAKDPNDPTIASRFMETVVQPTLEKQFTGEGKWSNAGARASVESQGKLIEHFGVKTAADMTVLAKHAAISNILELGNQASNAVVKDPSSFSYAIDAIDRGMENYLKSHSSLAAEDVAEIRSLKDKFYTDTAHAAIVGTVGEEPNADTIAQARADIASGKYDKYLNGQQTATLKEYVNQREKIAEEAKKAKRQETEHQEARAATADANKLLTGIIKPDGSAPAGAAFFNNVVKFAQNHPNAPEGLTSGLYNFGREGNERIAKGEFVVSDPTTISKFQERMLSDDPAQVPKLSELMQAVHDKKLSPNDMREMHQQVTELTNDKVQKSAIKRVDELAKGLDYKIDPSAALGAIRVPETHDKLMQFKDEVHQEAIRKYRDGTIGEMYKEGYIQNMALKYLMTPQQAMQQRLSNMRLGTGQPTSPTDIWSAPATAPKVPLSEFMKGQSKGAE